jgi:hypothetical protein
MDNSTITTQDEKEKWRALAKNLTKAQAAEVSDENKKVEPIDNDKKNPYISDTGGGEADSIDNLLNSTFKGDVKKLAEAYINSQKGAVKLAQEAKELKELKNRIDELGQKDPLFIEIIDAVKAGEPIRNRLEKLESKDKQQSPVKTDKPIQLTEQDLFNLGFLNQSDLNGLSSVERDYVILKAKIAAESKLIVDQTRQEILRSAQEMKAKEQEEYERQRLQKLADERYEKSLENVVIKYGVDFSGEHASMLDEIHEEMIAFRDPKDPRVIHPKAFELAFMNVAERKNIQLEKPTFTKPVQPRMDGQPQIGRKPETKEKTVGELLFEKQAKKFLDYQEKTQSLYKKF